MKNKLTPKEEANRLYRLFRVFNTDGNKETNHNTAIQIASIHIDEINKILCDELDFKNEKSILYYIDVKHELFNIKL